MRKPLNWAIAAVILFLGILLLLPTKPAEPSYGGRTLTKWLSDVTNPPISWSGPRSEHPLHLARQAVDAIGTDAGTNVVPTLLRLIRAKDSRTKTILEDLIEKQPLVHVRFTRATYLNKCGLTGFHVLRTNAQCAIPALLADFRSKDEGLRKRADTALNLIGYAGPR